MKKHFITIVIAFITATSTYSQNPLKYETKVEIIMATQQIRDVWQKMITVSNLGAIQEISNQKNAIGYHLILMNNINDIEGAKIVLVYEKSSSFREAELYKMINELTTRIDTTSKKYTDSAMVIIQTNVLNYLKSIPNEVITQEYKDQLTKLILSEAEDKIEKVVEELKKEIRNSSIGN
jgi:hypothetical protein